MLIDALRGKNLAGRPPVWIMRQAGRYLPQYRKLREKHHIMEMFHSADLIHDVTMLPIEHIGVDAAILFSDILILLDLFGVKWDVKPGVGPIITPSPLEKRSAQEALPFLSDGIQRLRQSLSVPLIGFCGAPFTVASYLIEGKPSKDLKKTRAMMHRDPEGFHQLLSTLTEGAIELLKFQIEAGVQAVQIFDSWAYWLGPKSFEAFSLGYMKRIAEAIDVPTIFFARGPHARRMATLGAVSLDWQYNMAEMRQSVSVPLQGNLDPALLYAKPQTIQQRVKELLNSMQGDPAYIVNLGHGVLPDTPVDHVRTLVDTVKEWA